jgi:very-short-patch-repair endonuclease
MKRGFTIEHIKQSKCAHLNQHLIDHPAQKKVKGKKVARHFKKKNKHLDWMGWNLLYWCNEHAVILEEEYQFNPERKWRFDWAIPSLKIAIEYEGGIFMEKSGHTSARGMTKDADKYNSAQALGWIVLRFTALNYKNLIIELNKIYGKEDFQISAAD